MAALGIIGIIVGVAVLIYGACAVDQYSDTNDNAYNT